MKPAALVPLAALLFTGTGCSDETESSATSLDGGNASGAGGVTSSTGGSPSTGGGTSNTGGSTSNTGGAMSNAGAGGTNSNAGAGGASPGTGGATATGGAVNGGSGGGATAEVRVVGRTDGDATAPRFEWSGVSIQARFHGTTAVADIDGGNNNYFEIIVDGQTKPKIATTAGRKQIDLVTGLPDADHDLVMWRRSEANDYAPSQFYGLSFGGGTLLPISAPPHKMEVVGDSITCGYGNEGSGPNCPFTYEQENNYLAYGSVAARALNADLHTECWSGKGVYRNRGNDTSEKVPEIFDRTIPTDASSTWDFSWKPDAIVIDLGTNDFADGDPGQGFVTAYENFVTTIRGHYPNAYVFVMIGPMTGEPDLTTTRGYLDQVVQARKTAGDARIQQVMIDVQDGTRDGLGCDYHPSIKTHDIVAQKLVTAVKSALGW